MSEAEARALFLEHCQPGDMSHYGEKAAVAAILEAVNRAPSSLDGRCGFSGGSALNAPRTSEWMAACEQLAARYDFWKLKDRAAQIRAGEPGWLIEQACVEALMASARSNGGGAA